MSLLRLLFLHGGTAGRVVAAAAERPLAADPVAALHRDGDAGRVERPGDHRPGVGEHLGRAFIGQDPAEEGTRGAGADHPAGGGVHAGQLFKQPQGGDWVQLQATEGPRYPGAEQAGIQQRLHHLRRHRSALSPRRAHLIEQLIGDERVAEDPYLVKVLWPFGFAHEVQVNCAVGGRAWGQLNLNRRTGREAFDVRDLVLLEAVAPHVTAALRAARARAALEAGPRSELGAVLLDAAGRIEVANGAAERWLSRPTGTGDHGSWVAVQVVASLLGRSLTEDGAEMIPALTLAGVEPGGAYELRAERVVGADGDPRTLVLIEPRRAADRTDALRDLGLTPREAAVALAVLRGQSTAAIAVELALSPYTVQDHVRHACEKLGVGSRRELAALLFGNALPARIDPHTLDSTALVS